MSERIEKIKALLAISPADRFLNHALALEYIKAGEDGTAKMYFETNLNNEPGYVATYYHLGKLLERIGDTTKAAGVYEAGMGYAKQAKDMHTYSELQNALEEL